MKILHLMLACFYIENYNYQENVLPRINKEDGHEVKIIASTETFVDNMSLGYINPCSYVNRDGIEVVRLPYKKVVCNKISTKVRSYVGLRKEIESFKPDIIFCHGVQFKDLDTVSEYKNNNPNVIIYADSHEDKHNSATSFISKHFLYKCFYNVILKRNIKNIERIFCISKESIDFMTSICNVPENKLSFFPLGGVILSSDAYLNIRKLYRKKLGVSETDIVIIHSGKMNSQKKTVELLRAFTKVNSPKLKLIIIGSASDDISKEFFSLIKSDERISFLGWMEPVELNKYLVAGDIYAQPGTQSATMQNAACACNAMMLYPYESHKYIFGEKALYVECEEDMRALFAEISEDSIPIDIVKKECFKVAKEVLDYNKMIQQIY